MDGDEPNTQSTGSAQQDLLLTINTGSSSLKAAVFRAAQPEQRLLAAEFQRIGRPGGTMRIVDGDALPLLEQQISFPDHVAALEQLFAVLDQHELTPRLTAVGHRLVHGGPHYTTSQQVNALTVDGLRAIVEWAPEHLPQAIAAIEFIAAHLPILPQVACFDTAFHSTLPRRARLFALPHALCDEGLTRFGFHGLSYEYLVEQLRSIDVHAAGGRAVLAHLGNGSSMAAVRDGVCIDTTMGFTPAGGLVMSTRTGDLDPGVLVYLLRTGRVSVDQLNTLVNKQSGLLGISGISSDMRDLLAQRIDNLRAADAVDLFCYQAKKFIAAFSAALGGLDTLVFTAGIGEHAHEVRAQICAEMEFLGVQLDHEKNLSHQPVISTPASKVTVRVIRTDEDLMIARHTRRVLLATQAGSKTVNQIH